MFVISSPGEFPVLLSPVTNMSKLLI